MGLREKIPSWHPGHLALIWVGYLVLLWFLWEQERNCCKEDALFLWAVLAIPAVWITWKWLSARPLSRKNDDSN